MPIFRDTMSRMYEIEAYTYEVVLPAMESIARLTDPLPWPRYEFSDVQGPPPHTLVLVDMRPEGFAMADRSVFLDAAHCRLALKQLARFHGAGLALKHLKPDHFEEIKKRLNLSIWDTAAMRENLKPYHSAMVQVPHVVRDKFPEGSDVHTRLKKLFGAFKEDSVALMGPLTGPGYTIIHNDLHVINMMYQYDRVTNAVTDCRLIDFQMCVYGLPALDIVTILLVCTDKPMRDLHWDNLLQGYHQELLATLSAAGCSEPEKLFPWTLLQDQLKIAAPYGLCVTPVYHFGLYSDAETVEELRQIMADNANSATNGEQRKVTLKVTPALKTRLEGLVQDVADKGWLPTVEELENRLAAYAQEKKSARVH
ncbi:uncharacterized protein LOC113213289 [Frankliniella occidentalis]|uniref:Uncharacterized protein LOC113213289 n=1 Tax=Frankliniella occidentalis TaxID=133901 RepID=A0A9C6U697_FRAOC|nr:uncharacterized protein LOC113213289 [Frankliniella occidentalis]